MELEDLRHKLNKSSNDLDVIRIENLTMEADLRKSREEVEQWKKIVEVVISFPFSHWNLDDLVHFKLLLTT